MTTLPFNRFASCAFCTHIAVTNVRPVGAKIEGAWKPKGSDFYGERGMLLAQRFANLPSDPSNILEFTKRYGPPSQDPDDLSGTFSFSLREWALKRRAIRESWKFLIGNDSHKSFHPETFAFRFEFKTRQLVIECPDLMSFMQLELASCARKLRLCAREECTTPYFVPQHGKERYCSIDCSNWAQSQWKKRWHEEQKKKKDSMRKGTKTDGTHKTR